MSLEGVGSARHGDFVFQLPTIIADNAGYDSADLVAQLRAAHQENKTTFGLSEFKITGESRWRVGPSQR